MFGIDITLQFDSKTALENFNRLSMSVRLLVLNWRMLRKYSQSDLAPSVLISTFCPSLNNSRLRIFSFSAGTPSSRSSLLFFRIRFFFRVSSFDRAGSINTPFCFNISRCSWLFANVRRASCPFGNVTSGVRGLFRSELNFPSLLSSTMLVLTPIVSRIPFTLAFVWTRFSLLLLLGSSGTPWIRKLWLMFWIVFPLLTLCEALVLPVSVDFSTATTAAYVFSHFFTGCLQSFTDFLIH